MTLILHNAAVFDGEAIHAKGSVIIEGGRITSFVKAGGGWAAPSAERGAEAEAQWEDLQGALLVPGFIDLQVNGAGILFNNERTAGALAQIASAHRARGTTAILPTLISESRAVMHEAAAAIRTALAEKLPGILGVHFEGPCLNPLRSGVHRLEYLRDLDADDLQLFTDERLGRVLVTLAPERAGADTIERLSIAGVHVAAGHSQASYEQTRAALLAGLGGFTHCFNAMAPISAREPGLLTAALQDEHAWCSVILDGHHLHPASALLALQSKPRGKVFMVSDSMALSTQRRSFTLYGERIEVEQGRCLSRAGRLAGACLDLLAAVQYAHRVLALPLPEALRMASLYPAQFLGIERSKGRIAAGSDADLLLLDAQSLQVRRVWVGGVPCDALGKLLPPAA